MLNIFNTLTQVVIWIHYFTVAYSMSDWVGVYCIRFLKSSEYFVPTLYNVFRRNCIYAVQIAFGKMQFLKSKFVTCLITPGVDSNQVPGGFWGCRTRIWPSNLSIPDLELRIADLLKFTLKWNETLHPGFFVSRKSYRRSCRRFPRHSIHDSKHLSIWLDLHRNGFNFSGAPGWTLTSINVL